MAVLIPSIGACVSRMTGGERRLAERLEKKLDDDYLLWYDVPVGPKTVASPLEQARQYAHQVVNALERDPQLVQPEGRYAGKLAFPWSYGVVLTNITRKQFEDGELSHAIAPHRVLCKDEMLESADAEALQSQLWGMFPYGMRGALSSTKPILILCFNEPLGVKLHSVMETKGLSDRVHVRHFHSWCHRQLTAYGQELPANNLPVGAKMAEMVDRVIRAVERSQIPGGQYQAVMIDEGHDFAPEWLKLVTQMVDPTTNSLLVLYDDAQSIYERARSKQFSFKSVGIQAQGRTTILKINYRNTKQILQTASLVAAEFFSPHAAPLRGSLPPKGADPAWGGPAPDRLLTAEEKDDDGIPLLKPISCGRDGEAPIIIRLPTLREEAFAIADHLSSAHKEGHAWGDMAILCADWKTMDLCADALTQRKLPFNVRKRSGDFNPGANAIQVMTMKVSKGLEFPVVALPGVGHMPAAGEDEKEAVRVFYVAATRATQRLVITVSAEAALGNALMKF